MDNLTHSLIGLAAAKAGLEKLSPGATTLCVLAANAPDADVITLIFGRWVFLHHHRGITHSIVGTFALAIALPLVFYLGDRIIARVRKRESQLRLKGLLLASILATATHPLMDWTNNYGVRPLLPWNPKWFYGDFVFIIDPFLWIVLGGAAFLLTSKTRKQIAVWIVIALVPSYLVLVGPAGPSRLVYEFALRLIWIVALIVLVTLYRRKFGGRRGERIAIAALLTATIYLGGLAAAHAVALHKAKAQANNLAASKAERVIQVAAMPTVANPTQWVCVMETDRATYKFKLSLFARTADESRAVAESNVIRYEKPAGATAEAMSEAERDARAKIFLDFARFPVVSVAGEDCITQTLVQFADLRYTEPGKASGTFSLDVPVDCPVPKAGR
jgi:inner membrane protein